MIVQRSVDSKRREHSTKTERTRRVDLSDALIEALQNQRKAQLEEAKARGQKDISVWVFAGQEGEPVDVKNRKYRHFFKCLEKAEIQQEDGTILKGLRRIRFHDLRHTFASLHLQRGESLKWVQEQMGHSSIKMTADVYAHLIPGANRAAANRMPIAQCPNLSTLKIIKRESA